MGKVFKGIKNAVFGGGGKGSKGYMSPYTREYENADRTGVYNSLGATSSKDAKGNTVWDTSNIGKTKTAADANSQYDYSNVDSAINGFKNSAYTPTKFNFADNDLIDQQSDLQYGLGAKNINRQGAGALEKVRETAGTRRPGLLAKAAGQNQRDVGEQLAGLNTNLRTSALGQKLSLGKDQQIAQAGENQYADTAGYRNNAALADAASNKINQQEGIRSTAQNEQDRHMEYLHNLLSGAAGWQNQSAQISQGNKSNTLGKIANIAGGVASIAKFI